MSEASNGGTEPTLTVDLLDRKAIREVVEECHNIVALKRAELRHMEDVYVVLQEWVGDRV